MFEVGVVTAHPVVFAWRQVKSVIRTWLFARKNGLPANKWYGVYQSGTEIVVAQVGCLPGAEMKSKMIVSALDEWDKAQGIRSA